MVYFPLGHVLLYQGFVLSKHYPEDSTLSELT
jgi:hypothetical protein